MTDFSNFEVDLDTQRPNPNNVTQVLRGDAPRTAFTKYNDLLVELNGVVRHIGPEAPSPTIAYMLWVDTSVYPAVERQRNEDNTAWGVSNSVGGLLGQPGGIAQLDAGGKVPAAQLPSYVDDVLEFPDLASFPAEGETGKIYVAIDTNRNYRWTGTAYLWNNPSPGSTDALAEGSVNQYFTMARVRETVLTGLTTVASAAIAATDTVLGAFAKLQAQILLKANIANPTFTGSVGIGGNPSNMLDVFKAGGGVIARVRNTANAYGVAIGTSAAGGYIDSENANLVFYRNGVQGMQIDANLNVSIGANNAPNNGKVLAVQNSGTGTAVVYVQNSTTGYAANNGTTLQVSSLDGYLWNYSAGAMVVGSNNIEAFRVDASQRLCIGKPTSLGYKVDLLGQIGVEDGTIRAGWGAGMFTAGTMGFGTTSNHRLTFGTNAIARMALSGSGTLSIGRLEPASGGMLEVSGSVVFQPPAAAPTLGTNGDLAFQRVNNTTLRLLMRGDDGVTRGVNLTLS